MNIPPLRVPNIVRACSRQSVCSKESVEPHKSADMIGGLVKDSKSE